MSAAIETRVVDRDRLVLPGVKLCVVGGPNRGASLRLTGRSARIGTSPDNDLVLTDDSVSRRHAELRLAPDEVRVVDLGSTNGTTVDGVRIREAFVGPGVTVRVGDTTIKIAAALEPTIVLLSSADRFGGLIGASAAMREVYAILERAGPTAATVLVQGETGTGKELVARAIHDHSRRAEGPFVAVDCGALTPSLVESELFGHVRGAFTGAVGDRAGVFEAAAGGTLFLDEIGELPIEAQAKLLRALEAREVRPVGSAKTRGVDVRVVAATNRPLWEEIEAGRFRQDLYFRLAVVQVALPPLRNRREDIPVLVRHFVEQFDPDGDAACDAMIRAFAARAWVGNVRELRNAVERALALNSIVDQPVTGVDQPVTGIQGGESPSFDGVDYKTALAQWVDLFDRRYVEHLLSRHGGCVSESARVAGVSRRHIQRIMKRLDIDRR